MKKMNLPNKLTVLRVVLIPLFMLFMLCFEIGPRLHTILAMAVFIIASLTDMLDGKIAREQNLVTNFGKFLDPLADKLLVMVALISFTFERWIDPVAVVIILAREFMVTGLRLHYGSHVHNHVFADIVPRIKGCARPQLGQPRIHHQRGAYLDLGHSDCDLGRNIPKGIRQIHRPQRMTLARVANSLRLFV